jgi:beta-N-acetylhexosaminidase
MRQDRRSHAVLVTGSLLLTGYGRLHAWRSRTLLPIRAGGLAAVAVAAAMLSGSAPALAVAPVQAAASVTGAAGNGGLAGATLTDPAVVTELADSRETAVAARMSARQLAGQRVIYSYAGLTPPADLLTLIRHGDVGGVIFFSGNYRSRSQFTAAVRKLQAANASAGNPARSYPLLLVTDQEGGQVRRLPGAPMLSEKQIGEITPLSAAEKAAGQAGAAAAANLHGYGLNVDLAPVLDVYRKAGDFDDQYQRSYSMNPHVVSALGASFVASMQADRAAAAVKHFPGLGAATARQDTDARPVTIHLSAKSLQGVDEYPYRAAIAGGVKLVMVSWAVYPHLGSALPAGLSSLIVQGQLRQRLGFTGVTITDSIGAGALNPYGSTQNRALLAARAGMDLILSAAQNYGSGVDCADGLENGYKDGTLTHAGFRAAVTQILALRATLAP